MRRVLVVGSSLVILALAGVLAVGVGARSVATSPDTADVARPRMVTPQMLQPLARGSRCLVSVPRCSQTPCVELIRSGASPPPAASVAAVARTSVVTSRPVPRLPASCRSSRTLPPGTSITVGKPSAAPVNPLGLALRLRAMAAQLAARHR